ncbi:MAG: hypothetical protein JSV82_01940 [Planctomycetota bacterium]|nr:MAG: hypothetical protein JSV82_01940 [Planctomycetota bacterium]
MLIVEGMAFSKMPALAGVSERELPGSPHAWETEQSRWNRLAISQRAVEQGDMEPYRSLVGGTKTAQRFEPAGGG